MGLYPWVWGWLLSGPAESLWQEALHSSLAGGGSHQAPRTVTGLGLPSTTEGVPSLGGVGAKEPDKSPSFVMVAAALPPSSPCEGRLLRASASPFPHSVRSENSLLCLWAQDLHSLVTLYLPINIYKKVFLNSSEQCPTASVPVKWAAPYIFPRDVCLSWLLCWLVTL